MCNIHNKNKNFIEIIDSMPKELKKKLYVPQFGEKYYFPILGDARFDWNCWEGTDEDIEILQLGLVCKTSKHATELADVMLGISSEHKAYKPKRDQIYWYPVLDERLIELERWDGDDFDIDNLYYGLVCKTEEQAEALAKELLAALRNYRSDWGEW